MSPAKKVKRRVRPDAGVNRQKQKTDEYQLCKTPECRNIIANWAQAKGPKRGYCGVCRKAKRFPIV